MIINEKVSVTVTSKTISYYENLGYDIPKKENGHYDIYKTFEVNSIDLQHGSSQQITAICDNCEENVKIHASSYFLSLKDNKYYCRKCKIMLFHSKENHWAWDVTKTQEEREKNRDCVENDIFIRKVMKRDNYLCKCCGKKGEVVHHLFSYSDYIDLRFDTENGVTLYKNCHKNFHSIYGYKHNIKYQFENWIKISLDFLKNHEDLVPNKQIICIETNDICDAKQFGKKYNLNDYIKLYDICNHKGISCNKLHFMYLDEYNSLSFKTDYKNIISYILLLHYMKTNKTDKFIVCLNNGIIFPGVKNAEVNMEIFNVSACCRGKIKSINKNNTLYKFIYYNDYLKLPELDRKDFCNKNKQTWQSGLLEKIEKEVLYV